MFARNNELLENQQPAAIPAVLRNTTRGDNWTAEQFRVAAEGENATVTVIEKPRFTQWGKRQIAVKGGYVVVPDDLVIMSIINRFAANLAPKIAYLGEWGHWNGAFATTVSHDSHNLTVFGGNESDIALAANTVASMQGGLAVVSNGKVLATLALPIAGLISEASTKELATRFSLIKEAMDTVVDWQPPYLIFKACFGASLICNAGPHLSDLGIVDTGLKKIQSSPLITE